jgi:glutamyl/glutaminyl-tRNA synthetase
VYLAPALSATKVHDGVFIHHELVRGEDGAKLSKSTLTTGPLPESDALLREIHRRAIELGGQVGISPAS